MQMFEETIWCLWDWYEYTDFQLQEADIDNLPELYEKDEIAPKINKKEMIKALIRDLEQTKAM